MERSCYVSDFRIDKEYNVKELYVLLGFINIHFRIESTLFSYFTNYLMNSLNMKL
mgnify:CR=1 FL=1